MKTYAQKVTFVCQKIEQTELRIAEEQNNLAFYRELLYVLDPCPECHGQGKVRMLGAWPDDKVHLCSCASCNETGKRMD